MRTLSRRQFLTGAALTGAVALAGFGGSLVWANQAVRQFANDTVLPLTPWTVNTYLVRGSRPLLVDTGFPADTPAIRAGLETHGITDLALILVTHGHYDHFGSAAALQHGSNTPVAAHPAASERLTNGRPTPVNVLTGTGQLISAMPTDTSDPVPVTPGVLLEDGTPLDAYGVRARVIHTPGHTVGSVSVLVNGAAIIGDLLAGNLLYPNRPTYPWFIDDRADQPLIVTSVARLLDEGAQVFFPGHGLPFDRAAASRWLNSQASA